MALLYLLSIYTYFLMLGRLYWVIYCLFIPNFFLLGPLCNVNFTANLANRGVYRYFWSHISRLLKQTITLSTYQHCSHLQLDFESRNLWCLFARSCGNINTRTMLWILFSLLCVKYIFFSIYRNVGFQGNINLERYYVSHGMRWPWHLATW